MKTYKKIILQIGVLMLLGIGIVVFLGWRALKPLYINNGFQRSFLENKITLVNSMATSEDIVDIIGSFNSSIYFKTNVPEKIYSINMEKGTRKYIDLAVPKNNKIASNYWFSIDSPFVYLMAGNMPGIIVNSPDRKPIVLHYGKQLFTKAVQIGPNTFVFRGIDSMVKKNQIFSKRNLVTNEHTRQPYSSTLKNDFGFSTDGNLVYDDLNHLLVYTHFFTNNIICLDTTLKEISKFKTIDTIGAYKYNIDISASTITNSGPLRVINSKNCIQNGILYNISKLRADNENYNDFIKSSVIDIYDIQAKKYLGSVRIPLNDNKKLLSFKVIDSQLIVLYQGSIVWYKI